MPRNAEQSFPRRSGGSLAQLQSTVAVSAGLSDAGHGILLAKAKNYVVGSGRHLLAQSRGLLLLLYLSLLLALSLSKQSLPGVSFIVKIYEVCPRVSSAVFINYSARTIEHREEEPDNKEKKPRLD